jgi:AraC-like DNA-binding protein
MPRNAFKAVTSLTPVQFQKQLRLVEARRLMLGAGHPASRAAYEVGYESVSQFTREYARMFGAPPRRDVRAQLLSVNDQSQRDAGTTRSEPAGQPRGARGANLHSSAQGSSARHLPI